MSSNINNKEHKVFIFGSKHFNKLSNKTIQEIEHHIINNHTILLHDDSDISLLIQEELVSRNYHNVVIYYAFTSPRNKLSNKFHTKKYATQILRLIPIIIDSDELNLITVNNKYGEIVTILAQVAMYKNIKVRNI
jgi:hypothetical protein